MQYSLYVDQLVLEKWRGQIDATDCLIIAFVRGLDANNPAIKRLMRDGFFLVTRRWLLGELPILQLSEQAVYKRLRKLKELGILESKRIRVESGNYLAYFKLSDAYYRVENKRHKDVDTIVSEDHGAKETMVSEDDDHSLSVSAPSSPETSNESGKDSEERDTPPSGSGEPTAELTDEDRAAATVLVQELLGGWNLQAHQRREDRGQLLEEQRAMLLGGSIAEGLTA